MEKRNFKVSLLLGSDPAVDIDGIGSYTELLYKHISGILDDEREQDLKVELVPFRPRSLMQWVRGFAEVLKDCDLLHIEYPFEGWGNSVGPGVCPGFMRVLPTYRKTKLVTTLHEWRMMQPLRKASILPLVYASDATLFVSNNENIAFKGSLYYKLRSKKPVESVIPIGINVKVPELGAQEILEKRNQLLNCNGVKVSLLITYFGLIYAAKQPYKMLRTLKVLLERKIMTRLVIVGDFVADHVAEKKKFLREVKSLGLEDYVLLLGYVSDERILAQTLSACNVALLLVSDGVSARRGGFWTLLELGGPIITTRPSFDGEFDGLLNLQCLHESLKLVDAGDEPECLASVISQFKEFHVPQQRRGIAPAWEAIASQHVDFYRRVLATR